MTKEAAPMQKTIRLLYPDHLAGIVPPFDRP